MDYCIADLFIQAIVVETVTDLEHCSTVMFSWTWPRIEAKFFNVPSLMPLFINDLLFFRFSSRSQIMASMDTVGANGPAGSEQSSAGLSGKRPALSEGALSSSSSSACGPTHFFCLKRIPGQSLREHGWMWVSRRFPHKKQQV